MRTLTMGMTWVPVLVPVVAPGLVPTARTRLQVAPPCLLATEQD